MGALALALAEGMDASPEYANGKLARELHEELAVLAKAELSPPTEPPQGRRAMSDAVDKHLDKAFASLDGLTVRELEATAEALSARRHPLHEFSSIFRRVADAREGSWDSSLPRFHLRENINRADEELAERIAEAEAPFWAHVRDALAERHP